MNEVVKTGLWVGDCFIYTNSLNRINYYVGGEIVTISHLDHTMYILGYVAKENRYTYLGFFSYLGLTSMHSNVMPFMPQE